VVLRLAAEALHQAGPLHEDAVGEAPDETPGERRRLDPRERLDIERRPPEEELVDEEGRDGNLDRKSVV
jgi:hypothetical protein